MKDVKKLSEAKVGETVQVEFSKFDRATWMYRKTLFLVPAAIDVFIFSVAPGTKYNRILFLAWNVKNLLAIWFPRFFLTDWD